MKYTLRAVQEDDSEFLLELFASAHRPKFVAADLPENLISQLLRTQFEAQSAQYHSHYPGRNHSIAVVNEVRAGSVVTNRTPEELRLIDIALLPEYQNVGLGSRLIQKIIDEARSFGIPARLQVEHDNPAARLYTRLGFKPTSHDDIRIHMECGP